jgi:hypothetical protein
MTRSFRVGDRVQWNSEAGRVRGRIIRKVTSEITFKGYRRHASKEEPQYLIKSERTDHVAIHKGAALRKLAAGASSRSRPAKSQARRKPRRRSSSR